MGNWEAQFSSRMNALHHASSGNFDDLVQAEIMPAFEDLKTFVTSGGFAATAMKGCDKIRPFRFSLSKEMFIDLFFRRRGPAEVTASFQLHHPFTERREAVVLETVPLSSVTEGWARQQFQICLDEFLSEVEALIGTGVPVVVDPPAASTQTPASTKEPTQTKKDAALVEPVDEKPKRPPVPKTDTPSSAPPAAKNPPPKKKDDNAQQSAA